MNLGEIQDETINVPVAQEKNLSIAMAVFRDGSRFHKLVAILTIGRIK